jgi:hypothetical protein
VDSVTPRARRAPHSEKLVGFDVDPFREKETVGERKIVYPVEPELDVVLGMPIFAFHCWNDVEKNLASEVQEEKTAVFGWCFSTRRVVNFDSERAVQIWPW